MARGAAAAVLSSSGLTGRSTIALGLGATLVVSTGAVTMAMGFGLFGKRRRDGEQTESDEFLAAAAASGLGTVPTDLAALAVAVETRGPGGVVGATDQAGLGPDAVPEPDQDETLLPRWRRPSLLVAARPTRSATTSRHRP